VRRPKMNKKQTVFKNPQTISIKYKKSCKGASNEKNSENRL
jgi:hypothetical protein